MPKIAEDVRAARRSHLVAAALACFARAGYHATTMADVAAEAAVSKGTPYLYFTTKEQLFLALHEEWDCGVSAQVETAVAALPAARRRSPRRVLHTVAAAVGAHVVEHADTCRVLMEARTLGAHTPAVAQAVEAADDRDRGHIADLVAAGVRAGEWPPGTDPALQARMFVATLHGLMSQWHLAPGSFSWDDAVTALVPPQ